MMKNYFLHALLFPCLLAASTSFADDCENAQAGCVEVGTWQVSLAIGAGVRTNPVMNNDDIPLIVLPQISYTGERFFLQNLDMGLLLHEDDRQQVNVLVTPSYDQVFFKRWDANNFVLSADTFAEGGTVSTGSLTGEDRTPAFGPSVESRHLPIDTDQLRKRRMGGLVGFEYSRAMGKFDWQVHALQEFTGYHDGQEVRISLARNFYSNKHHLALSAGAIWQSEQVLDYYYGIEQGEGGAGDYRYKPGSGFSQVVRLDWHYQLTQNWSLTFTSAYRALASEIRDSPIITDNHVITVFAGGVYHF